MELEIEIEKSEGDNRLFTGKFILAVVILFGICMCSNIVLSVLTIFAKNLTGLDTYAGLMTSVFTLAALSVRFVAGFLLDKFNCKKVVLIGVGMMIGAAVLFIGCNTIFQAIIYRAIQGVGFGIASTGASTYVTKITNPNRLLEGVGYAAIANSLTGVIGPSIAFMLIGSNYDNFTLLFIVATVMAIGTFGLMLLGKDVEMTKVEKSVDGQGKIVWGLLALPIVILFLNCLTQSAITSFVSLYAISLGFAQAGLFFSVNAIGMIASRFFMNRLVSRFGQFRMLLMNSAVFFTSIFLVSMVQNNWQLVLLAIPSGFAMGSVAPIINTYLIKNMPKHKSGIANATYYASMDIAYAIGSLMWGAVAMYISYRQVFFIAAMIQIACMILSVAQTRLYKSN